jgi:hypothetical protein
MPTKGKAAPAGNKAGKTASAGKSEKRSNGKAAQAASVKDSKQKGRITKGKPATGAPAPEQNVNPTPVPDPVVNQTAAPEATPPGDVAPPVETPPVEAPVEVPVETPPVGEPVVPTNVDIKLEEVVEVPVDPVVIAEQTEEEKIAAAADNVKKTRQQAAEAKRQAKESVKAERAARLSLAGLDPKNWDADGTFARNGKKFLAGMIGLVRLAAEGLWKFLVFGWERFIGLFGKYRWMGYAGVGVGSVMATALLVYSVMWMYSPYVRTTEPVFVADELSNVPPTKLNIQAGNPDSIPNGQVREEVIRLDGNSKAMMTAVRETGTLISHTKGAAMWVEQAGNGDVYVHLRSLSWESHVLTPGKNQLLNAAQTSNGRFNAKLIKVNDALNSSESFSSGAYVANR